MFCGKCGTRNPEVNRFCRECGAKLPERPKPKLTEEAFADLQAPQAEVKEPLTPSDTGEDQVAALMDKAFACHHEGKMDEAVAACLGALALNADSTSAHSLLAILYEQKGQFDEAMAHQQRVLEMNPDSTADKENLERLMGKSSLASPAAFPDGSGLAAIIANKPLLAGIAAGLVTLLLVLTITMRALNAPGPQDTAQRSQYNPVPSQGLAPYSSQSQATTTAAPYGTQTTTATNPFMSGAMPTTARPAQNQNTGATTPQRNHRNGAAAGSIAASAGESDTPIEPLPPIENPQQASARATYLSPQQNYPQRVWPARNTAPQQPTAAAPSLEPTFTPAAPTSAPAANDNSRIVIKVSPATPRHYEKWGYQSAADGKYDAAVNHLQKALDGSRSAADRARIHQQMGYAYQQMGRKDAAANEYRSAISHYQEQINQGDSPELARAGIRSSEAGLRDLGQ